MSFKYRFIVSFVLLEVFFIVLIVTMNFVAINNSSNKLIKDRIDSNITFLEELLKVPISIYDIATIDNLLVKTKEQNHVDSIVLLDAQNRILSKEYHFKHETLENIVKKKANYAIELEDEIYEVRYKEIKEEDITFGSMFLVFDTSQNKQFIAKSKNNTMFIIMIEILISTILSFIIGSKLTNMLTKLSEVSQEIGEGKNPEIPYQDKKNEIGVLASSLHQMQLDLIERRTKLKTLATELNNQRKELIEANKAKDDFLANMSHELKTPLNSINVISSVMMKNKKGTLNESEVKNLSIINSCGNDLLFLINDVLDISKLEAGQIELNNATINVNELINQIIEMISPQVKEKGLTLVCDCSKDIGYIFSDDNRIKQVIKNLLSNALKFTQKGEIKLIVKNNNDFLDIYVKDSGIGIEQEKLETIFDRFKQADSSTTRKFGGTGLGLAISKQLSQLMGGDIEVKSKVNEGTIFKVSILRNEQNVVTQKVNFSKELEPEVVKESQKNILILNNDPVSFLSIVVELKKVIDVIQVSSIKELLEKLQSEVYDFVMVDCNNLDLKPLVNMEFSSELILVSKDDLDDEIKNKTKHLLNKPINKDEIISIVKG